MASTIITRTSPGSFEAVCGRIPTAAAKHKFGVLGMHDLREKIVAKGLPFERECRVFEVCNPQQAQLILSGDIAVSTALPCRISVYVEDGKTVLATIEPTALLGLFPPSSEGRRIAEEVRASLLAIMDDSCAT